MSFRGFFFKIFKQKLFKNGKNFINRCNQNILAVKKKENVWDELYK
jgi:hypothetical protein